MLCYNYFNIIILKYKFIIIMQNLIYLYMRLAVLIFIPLNISFRISYIINQFFIGICNRRCSMKYIKTYFYL